MIQLSIRLPADWRDDLVAEYGSLQGGIEALVSDHRAGVARLGEELGKLKAGLE